MNDDLQRDGFVLLTNFLPQAATLEVASTLGKVVDIQTLLPGARIPTVQTLRPRDAETVANNQYSGIHGLGAFPLHTDLAHWAVPPRYFILRCVTPAEEVCTRALRWSQVTPALGSINMEKAVFAGRKKQPGYSGLVRAMSRHEEQTILRWDSLFLQPINEPARDLDAILRDEDWSHYAERIPLRRPGDMILFDNWRTLHGRDSVPVGARGRLLERVYLSELKL